MLSHKVMPIMLNYTFVLHYNLISIMISVSCVCWLCNNFISIMLHNNVFYISLSLLSIMISIVLQCNFCYVTLYHTFCSII